MPGPDPPHSQGASVVCPGCGRTDLDPLLALCPDCAAPLAAPRPRFCRRCRYDLAGIDWAPAACPECGLVFDPDDPTTTELAPRPPMIGATVRRVGVPVIIVLLVLTAFTHTLLPRPQRLRDWRLWVWLDAKYGVQSTWIGGARGQIDWWADRITAIHAYNPAGNPLWNVRWQWPDHWTIIAHQPGVRWQDLSAAFTAMKRDMFGITLGPFQRESLDQPFSISGSKIEVFSALIDRFGIQITPFLLRKDQPYLWVYDPLARAMVPISRAHALELGIDASLWRGGERPEPLVPIPSHHATPPADSPASP